MRDHVLGQLKQMAEKCACSDVTDPGNAYDLISNLIYCVDIIATEMPPKEQMQLLETEKERARFERWVNRPENATVFWKGPGNEDMDIKKKGSCGKRPATVGGVCRNG